MLPEEFEAAVVRHYDTLLRLAVQRAGSRTEAEDIVQDTFLQLLRSGRTFDDEEHLKAFLASNSSEKQMIIITNTHLAQTGTKPKIY